MRTNLKILLVIAVCAWATTAIPQDSYIIDVPGKSKITITVTPEEIVVPPPPPPPPVEFHPILTKQYYAKDGHWEGLHDSFGAGPAVGGNKKYWAYLSNENGAKKARVCEQDYSVKAAPINCFTAYDNVIGGNATHDAPHIWFRPTDGRLIVMFTSDDCAGTKGQDTGCILVSTYPHNALVWDKPIAYRSGGTGSSGVSIFSPGGFDAQGALYVMGETNSANRAICVFTPVNTITCSIFVVSASGNVVGAPKPHDSKVKLIGRTMHMAHAWTSGNSSGINRCGFAEISTDGEAKVFTTLRGGVSRARSTALSTQLTSACENWGAPANVNYRLMTGEAPGGIQIDMTGAGKPYLVRCLFAPNCRLYDSQGVAMAGNITTKPVSDANLKFNILPSGKFVVHFISNNVVYESIAANEADARAGKWTESKLEEKPAAVSTIRYLRAVPHVPPGQPERVILAWAEIYASGTRRSEGASLDRVVP